MPAGSRRRDRRGVLPLWGILLVALGVVLLLQTTGVVPWALWVHLWRFWPVLLVIAGVQVLLGRRRPEVAGLLVGALLLASVGGAYALALRDVAPAMTTVSLAEPMGDLRSAEVHLAFGAGQLRVGALPEGSPDLVRGDLHTPGRVAAVSLTRADGTARLHVSPGPADPFGWLRAGRGAEWEVSFSREAALSLDVDGGAASMDLDLRHLRVDRLALDVGAAEVRLTVPARGESDVVVSAGAASITVVVPEGVAARINRRAGLASFDVDTARFPRGGDVYQSPGYAEAEHRVSIDLRVGASSVTVR